MLRNLTLEKLPKKIFSDTFIHIEVQVLSVRPVSAWTQTLPKQFTSARTCNNICELETCHGLSKSRWKSTKTNDVALTHNSKAHNCNGWFIVNGRFVSPYDFLCKLHVMWGFQK